jgi:hypothetical protein
LKKPKGVIKDRQTQKDRQHKGQKFEDTKSGNQRSSITEEGQTTQEPKFEETKRGNQRPSITEGQATQRSKV